MIAALVILGILAQATAWHLSRLGRVQRWAAAGWVFIVLGVISALSGRARLWGDGHGPTAALVVGVVSALVLFASTRTFLWLVRNWTRFTRDTARLYEERGRYPVTVAIVAASLIAAGEELFWRGVVRGSLVGAIGTAGAAGISLFGYVAVSVIAFSSPIAVASIICGAVWSALVLWSGGVAASIACHAVWTGLMIAFPPTTEGLRRA